MSRKKLNVEKKSIRFYKGDIDIIEKHYPNIPHNAIVRELIHIFANNLESGRTDPLVYDPSRIQLEHLS